MPCMNNNVCLEGDSVQESGGTQARECVCDNNRGREVIRLTLPHFQHHLHALRGAHSASHAVQALARPV